MQRGGSEEIEKERAVVRSPSAVRLAVESGVLALVLRQLLAWPSADEAEAARYFFVGRAARSRSL